MAITPHSFWISGSRAESATESAIGISISTCLPARIACSACWACTWVGLAIITASSPGCFSVSDRSVVQCGMFQLPANSRVPAGRPPVSEMTSIPGIFWMAFMCWVPKAPCPARAIFICWSLPKRVRQSCLQVLHPGLGRRIARVVDHDVDLAAFAALGHAVHAAVRAKGEAVVRLPQARLERPRVRARQVEPRWVRVPRVQRQVAEAGPRRIAGVHLIDARFEVVAPRFGRPERVVRCPAGGPRSGETVGITVQL